MKIVDEILVCPYCMDEVNADGMGCCGESSAHFTKAYVCDDGEYYLEDELPKGVGSE